MRRDKNKNIEFWSNEENYKSLERNNLKRICSRCTEEKPIWLVKHVWCNDCRKKYNEGRREEDSKRVKFSQDGNKEYWSNEENYDKKDWENEVKRCYVCEETKSIKCFRRKKQKKDGLNGECEICDRKRIRKMEKEDKNGSTKKRRRKKNLKRYGLTVESFEQLKSEQKNKCKICRIETEKLVVDHCHKTGKIRGLLCSNCNIGIGNLKDDTETLQNAINYLNECKNPK
ncbi:MAG: endonuclease VII domain-containing protein [Nanoarchaeota archaeon]|nr:endonuclease VII domain-containing protein [Nanoarchaeota archaeon]